ncbi:hypothetical protein BC834DRAFT_972779 [Gloeopeniophorella convolvens]|nr:hypothetical protein BC834DRAFT_972779 [Gloeopeniophorella convolvens]
MAEPVPIPPNIAQITGPILFGPMINWALYGVLSVQIYVYSYNFPDDRWRIKLLAYFVFLLETAQTAMTGADVYFWFIAGFGNLDRLTSSNLSAIDSPTIDAFISLIVQGFFCYRIWALNKRFIWMCVIIAVLSVIQAIGAAWGGIKSATLGRYATVKVALYMWLIPSALADILIAATMTLLLRQARGNNGRYSSHVLPRIVRITVETNSLTASVAIVSFILYVAFPNNIYYTCPTGVIGKLYSNTLLVTLNNRIYFRDRTPPGSFGDSVNLAENGAIRQSVARSIHFTKVRPSHTTTNDTFRLDTLSQSLEAEADKSDVNTPLELSHHDKVQSSLSQNEVLPSDHHKE